jgi:predicted DNA-binding transcriptional regulator AlpA
VMVRFTYYLKRDFDKMMSYGYFPRPEKFGTGSSKIYSYSISASASCRENIFGRYLGILHM